MQDLDKSRLLSKLISEGLNTAEKQKLEEWLSQSEDNVVHKEELQRIWELSKNYESNFNPDLDKGLAKFKMRTQQSGEQTDSPKIIRMKPGRLLIRVAAVFLLLVAATFLIKPDLFLEENPQLATTEEISNSNLSDGTQVWLNKNSSLDYADNFGETNREVFLKGEAFFDVVRDTEKPFIINTGNSRVTVLGTAFNLNEDIEKGQIILDVTIGLVAFESTETKEQIKVKAGESAIYDTENGQFKHFVSKTTNANSWLDNKFSYNGTPLRIVFEELSNHFDVEFDVLNEVINDCGYSSGEFTMGSIDDIIESLEVSFPIKIEKENNIYKVQGSHCK